MSNTSEILLLLFIMFLGTSFGAGIYEARIILPQWFTKSENSYSINAEAMQRLDSGRKFWGAVTTMPLTLLTILNLVWAWESLGPRHDWWMMAALITLTERLMTFLFFIPTIIKLQKGTITNASSKIALWIRLNYIRNILTLIALTISLRAFWLHL